MIDLVPNKEKFQELNILETKDEIFISNIIVKPGWRGKGYGAKALKYILNYAKKNGKKVHGIINATGKKRRFLKQFYENLGFEIKLDDEGFETFEINNNLLN